MFESLVESPYFPYVMPVIIFFARTVDVTFGTMRTIFVAKGFKKVAPVVGFIEIFIWIVVISQIMQHANNIYCYLAYAGGFAMGNIVGMWLESRLAIGVYIIRVITPKDGSDLVKLLNDGGYGATVVHGQGKYGKVDLIYSVVNRKTMESVEKIIAGFDPNVFYVVEDVRTAKRGIIPSKRDAMIGTYQDKGGAEK